MGRVPLGRVPLGRVPSNLYYFIQNLYKICILPEGTLPEGTLPEGTLPEGDFISLLSMPSSC